MREHFSMDHVAVSRSMPLNFGRLWNPTTFLCLVAVVLPNALSLTALVLGIGSPPRTGAIIAYATVALVARNVPPPVTIALYLATAAYDAVATIALLFNLAPSEILVALHLTADLKLFSSPLYVAMISGLVLLVGVNIVMLTMKRETLRLGNPLIMMGCALAFAAADFLVNTSPHYQFGTLYASGKPMESAADDSGFREMALSGKRNRVVMVVVEALGHFANPASEATLLSPFADGELRKHYTVTSGSATYYGSTTAAEMRELCDTRNPYQDVLAGKPFVCLPKQMKDRGYRTIALHNFTGAFFERLQWYPKLGFQDEFFFKDLAPLTHRLCGGPFRGPCDADVAPIITQKLREAKQPTFFYWMTLSTHVPIAPHEGTPRLKCEQGGGAIGNVEVCYMTELWMDLFQSVAQLARDLPGTEIMLVGDHAPPLWSKAGRRLFTPGKVTWVRLTPKPGEAQVSRQQP
jgi:Sulfatase